MTEPSDTDLMAELARGDVAALAPLITRHQPRVLSLAYRMLGRWDQAEDVGQEAFLRVVRAAGSYRPTAQFTTWLYRIVVNLCLDAKRRSARDPGELAESVAAASGDNPQADAEAREQAAFIRGAVDSLSDRQRTVVILHRYHGLSHQEVAEATGWSVSAVESLLVRAYANLRKSLAGLEKE